MIKYIFSLGMLAAVAQAYAATLEQQITEHAYIGEVNTLISPKFNKRVNDYIQRQTILTPQNTTSLIRLALGVNPKTGYRSGSVSIKAIQLVKDALTAPSSIKNLLEWMVVVLNDPLHGFKTWQLKPELSAIYNDYPLLSCSVLIFIEKQSPGTATEHGRALSIKILQEQQKLRNEIGLTQFGADFYNRFKQYGLPEDHYNLGFSIVDGEIITDLMDIPFLNDSEKYEAAAACYREAIKRKQIPEAYYNLGNLIMGQGETDLAGNQISSDVEKYEAAAECYREAIKGGHPDAYHNLGNLIAQGRVTSDLAGKNFSNDSEKYEAARFCYREAIKRGQLSDDNSNLAYIYIIHDFGLSDAARLVEIKKLLGGKSFGQPLLAAACLLLGSKKEFDFQWMKALTQTGCSSEELHFSDAVFQENAEDSSEDEGFTSTRTSQLSTAPPASPVMTLTLDAIESLETSARHEMFTALDDAFMKLITRFSKTIDKLSKPKPLSKKEKLLDQIKKRFQDQVNDPSRTNAEKKVRFTENAHNQFLALDQTGRDRFFTLIQAIENGETTGDEEMLVNAKQVDGKPVMTRRMTQADRLAYTNRDGVITVLSLERHYHD
jgi:tetratricopeptide (TPR) repeat protein/Txe/YoeB family toxin of Txe-Axe toxin-antitoxin module